MLFVFLDENTNSCINQSDSWLLESSLTVQELNHVLLIMFSVFHSETLRVRSNILHTD